MKERRRDSRFTIRQAVEIQFGKERFTHLSGYDLSRGGLGAVSREPLELSSRVYLIVEVHDDEISGTIAGEAQVNHCTLRDDDTYFVGLEFLDLSATSSSLLERYLQHLSSP